MSFAEFYVLKERFKPSKDDRFLALAIDEDTWNNYIIEVTNVWEKNNIYKPLKFVISDKSGSFIIHLNWDEREKVFTYNFDNSSIPYLSERGLTEDNPEQAPWCYYDESDKVLVIKGKKESGDYKYPIKNKFNKGHLSTFLEDLFMANNICEQKAKVSIIYVLYFIDKLSLEEAEKIKRNNSTPEWLEYALKDDNSRGADRGFFSTLFK